MQDITLISSVAVINILAAMSPGPDFVMVVRNSLTYSRKTGIWTAIGFAFGILVHIAYCVAGLALIISKSILVFNSIKLLGAFYLIYIGTKSIFSKDSKIEIKEEIKKEDISAFQAWRIGFFTNVLNPKATIYFLSLFTFVIKPETSTSTLIILTILMFFEQAGWFSLVAIFFTQKRVQNVFSRFQSTFNKIFGGLLVALGIKIALSHK